MRFMIPWMICLTLLLAVGCSSSTPEKAPPADSSQTEEKSEPVLEKLQVRDVAPDIPADQSTPENTVRAFFGALKITMNSTYQVANQNPEQNPDLAHKYQEARSRLRRMFTRGNTYTNTCAYLELIRLQEGEVKGKADIEDNSATVKVRLTKGEGLSLDPKAFGETSDTEATTKVELVKQEEQWLIRDFGGLAGEKAGEGNS